MQYPAKVEQNPFLAVKLGTVNIAAFRKAGSVYARADQYWLRPRLVSSGQKPKKIRFARIGR